MYYELTIERQRNQALVIETNLKTRFVFIDSSENYSYSFLTNPTGVPHPPDGPAAPHSPNILVP